MSDTDPIPLSSAAKQALDAYLESHKKGVKMSIVAFVIANLAVLSAAAVPALYYLDRIARDAATTYVDKQSDELKRVLSESITTIQIKAESADQQFVLQMEAITSRFIESFENIGQAIEKNKHLLSVSTAISESLRNIQRETEDLDRQHGQINDQIRDLLANKNRVMDDISAVTAELANEKMRLENLRVSLEHSLELVGQWNSEEGEQALEEAAKRIRALNSALSNEGNASTQLAAIKTRLDLIEVQVSDTVKSIGPLATHGTVITGYITVKNKYARVTAPLGTTVDDWHLLVSPVAPGFVGDSSLDGQSDLSKFNPEDKSGWVNNYRCYVLPNDSTSWTILASQKIETPISKREQPLDVAYVLIRRWKPVLGDNL